MARLDNATGSTRFAKARQLSLLALKFLVSGLLLYFVISRSGLEKIFSTLRGINMLSFAAASLIYVFSVYLSSLRWRYLLSGEFGVGRLFSLYIMGSFFNTLLPGIIGGDAVKAYYLYRDTGKSAPAVASVFMDRYIGFSALMAMGVAAYPFGMGYFGGSYIEWFLPLVVILFIAGSLTIMGLRIGKSFRILSEIYDYLAMYRERPLVLAKTFILSLIVQVTGVVAVFVIGHGLKVELPLLPLFIFLPIISTLTTVPLSISGIGVREASFVLLFGYLGINPVEATAISFAWFLSVVVGSTPGLIEYLRYRRG